MRSLASRLPKIETVPDGTGVLEPEGASVLRHPLTLLIAGFMLTTGAGTVITRWSRHAMRQPSKRISDERHLHVTWLMVHCYRCELLGS